MRSNNLVSESNMSKSMSPLVTIGLTTFNRPDLLKESVKSVLNQKYKNFKLIIGNDYPKSKVTFETLGIENDPRIEIINFQKNIGEIKNLNYLLSRAKSDWFTWLADDDIFHESFLELTTSTLKKVNNEVIAIYSNFVYGENLNDDFFHQNLSKNSTQYSPSEFIFKYLSRDFNIVGCYGLMRTHKLKEIGGFPSLGPSQGSYGDTLIPILLSEYGKIIVTDDPLVFVRTHSESYSAWVASLSHYTSAESEFLIKLSMSCDNLMSNSYKNKCIYQMIRWFTENEFAVLFRVPPGSDPLTILDKFIQLVKLLVYQIKVNYPRIKIRYWLSHTLHIIKLIFGFFTH